MDFDPDYPTKASQRYRDHFLEGAAEGAVVNLEGTELLSLAVTVAMGAETPIRAHDAGKLFAELYVRISKRREFKDKNIRHGIWNQTAYLIAAYQGLLVQNHKKRC